jgi:hypothetical protein
MTQIADAFLASALVPDAVAMTPEKHPLPNLPPAVAGAKRSSALAARPGCTAPLRSDNPCGDSDLASGRPATARTIGPSCRPEPARQSAGRRTPQDLANLAKARITHGIHAAAGAPAARDRGSDGAVPRCDF